VSSTVQTDLATWLLEQVAEDERRAKAAQARTAHRDEPDGYASWRVSDGGMGVYGEHVCLMVGPYDYLHDELGEHVVTWAPGRVLVECDTKRRIIELHQPKTVTGTANGKPVAESRCASCADLYPCQTLRLLALPYADRPGYRDEWDPE
jgi:hypothetical protein